MRSLELLLPPPRMTTEMGPSMPISAAPENTPSIAFRRFTVRPRCGRCSVGSAVGRLLTGLEGPTLARASPRASAEAGVTDWRPEKPVGGSTRPVFVRTKRKFWVTDRSARSKSKLTSGTCLRAFVHAVAPSGRDHPVSDSCPSRPAAIETSVHKTTRASAWPAPLKTSSVQMSGPPRGSGSTTSERDISPNPLARDVASSQVHQRSRTSGGSVALSTRITSPGWPVGFMISRLDGSSTPSAPLPSTASSACARVAAGTNSTETRTTERHTFVIRLSPPSTIAQPALCRLERRLATLIEAASAASSSPLHIPVEPHSETS